MTFIQPASVTYGNAWSLLPCLCGEPCLSPERVPELSLCQKEKGWGVEFEAEHCLRNLQQRRDFDTNDRWKRVCSSALLCVCVIYNIITARDWLRVTIYLNCAQISLASVDNWENFPRGTEIYGDFIYFRFQNPTPILTALSQVYYQSFVSFHKNKH